MRASIRRFLRWAYTPFIKDDAANFSQELAWWVATRLKTIDNDNTGPAELSLSQWRGVIQSIYDGMVEETQFKLNPGFTSQKINTAFQLLAKYYNYI